MDKRTISHQSIQEKHEMVEEEEDNEKDSLIDKIKRIF
jgi:hypothetical protein